MQFRKFDSPQVLGAWNFASGDFQMQPFYHQPTNSMDPVKGGFALAGFNAGAFLNPDVCLMRWKDDSEMPTSGKNLMVIGILDTISRDCPLKVFAADGQVAFEQTDMYQPVDLDPLRDRLLSLLPPHVLTDAEKAFVATKVGAILANSAPPNGLINWWGNWTGTGDVTLNANDRQFWYAATCQQKYKGLLGLADGTSQQVPNESADNPYGRFTLVNLGAGKVALQQGGKFVSFRRRDWWGGSFVPFTPVEMVDAIGEHETLSIEDSNRDDSYRDFVILLLSQSGAGLRLRNRSLGHFITSIAGTDFSSADLRGANLVLDDRSLAKCNFTNAHLEGAYLDGCEQFNIAIWISAHLDNTDLSKIQSVHTQGTDFTDTTLTGTIFTNGQPTQSNFDYRNSKFIRASLDGAKLQNVNLKGACFTSATLKGTDLDGADLSGADLTGADLSGATLANTNLTGAILHGAKFTGCNLSSTIFSPSPDFGRSESTRTSFENAVELPASKLGRDWSYLDLTGAKLTEIPKDLAGINAQYTLFPSRLDMSGVNFRGGHFEHSRMYYADLRKADLDGACLDGAFLKGAILNEANLNNASMKGTWLTDETEAAHTSGGETAQAIGAFLINTCLSGAHCDGADFSNSIFITNKSLTPQHPASADDAYLNRARFSNAVVIDVSFQRTYLAGVAMDNAKLIASKFPSAKLNVDSSFKAPTMQCADLRGVEFADVIGGGAKNPADMNGLNMQNATCSIASGTFELAYRDY